MERRITSGETAGSRLGFSRTPGIGGTRLSLVVVGCAVLTTVGCGGPRAVPGPEFLSQSPGRGHEQALRDARAEAADLRAAVATARIASAKQEAELQDLRRQVGELQQTLLTKQHDLATLRQERDGLLQASAEIQAQVVTVAESPQPEREAKAADPSMSRRLGQLESMVQALRASLEQMHKDVAKLRARSVTKGKPKPMAWAGSETGHP